MIINSDYKLSMYVILPFLHFRDFKLKKLIHIQHFGCAFLYLCRRKAGRHMFDSFSPIILSIIVVSQLIWSWVLLTDAIVHGSLSYLLNTFVICIQFFFSYIYNIFTYKLYSPRRNVNVRVHWNYAVFSILMGRILIKINCYLRMF